MTDPGVARRAFRRADRFGATPREKLALAMAGLVETNFTHLTGGDRDSTGFLQQRPSQGWGPIGETVGRDTVQFLRAARKLTQQGFKGSAGDLAQAVQRSAFPERYDQRRGDARALLAQFGAGGGAGAGGGSAGGGSMPGGTVHIPGSAGRQISPGGEGMLPLLQSLLGGQEGPQGAQSSGVPLPSFAAGPAMPQGLQTPVSSGGPARRPDMQALLAAVSATSGGGIDRAGGGGGSVQMPGQQPGGGAGGQHGGSKLGRAVSLVDGLIGDRAPITAKQEPGHATGGDHDPAVKGATARDVGGSEGERQAIWADLMRELGVRGATYKGPDVNVTRNGVRYQVISRDHGSGPHLHIGMRRVRRG